MNANESLLMKDEACRAGLVIQNQIILELKAIRFWGTMREFRPCTT
jgi:hypothetical protein